MANNDSKIMEPFVKAYEIGYRNSNASSHAARRKDARIYASMVSPIGGQAISAFGKCAAQKRVPGNGTEWLGQRISGALSRLMKRSDMAQMRKSLGKRQAVIQGEDKGASVQAFYRSLVDKFDCVPSDSVLEHLNGHSRANFSTARGTLKKRYGYSFSSLGDAGWRVDRRPNPTPIVFKNEQGGIDQIQMQLPTPPDIDLIASVVAEVMKQLGR